MIWTPQRQQFQRQQIRQRQQFFMPGCTCCGTSSCAECAVTPAQYTFGVFSVTGGALCAGCTAVNGTIILTHHSMTGQDYPDVTCSWSSPLHSPAPCFIFTNNQSLWTLQLSAGGKADLYCGGALATGHDSNFGAAAHYGVASGWDCATGGNLAVITTSSSVICANWPAVISVAPV